MDRLDLQGFRTAYDPWLAEQRPALEAHDFRGALRAGYPYVTPDHTPWTPLAKPLAEATVAVLSTAGLYVAGEQQPFDAENVEGDWTHRELPAAADPAALRIAHTHYDHTSALQDREVVYPLQRLRELADAGVIGGLADTHYSISGYCLEADRVAGETGPAIAAHAGAAGVDVVLHVPV